MKTIINWFIWIQFITALLNMANTVIQQNSLLDFSIASNLACLWGFVVTYYSIKECK